MTPTRRPGSQLSPTLRRIVVVAPLVVLLAAVIVLLVGVGDGDGDGPPPGGEAFPTTTTDPDAVVGGVLRLGIESPATLDPARARPVPISEPLVAGLLFDGLTGIDATSGEVVPALAEWWDHEEHRVWRFRLRQGVTFHDGSLITAGDVVFSLERVIDDPESPSALALEIVAGVEAETDRHVRIELLEPLADFPSVLTNPALGIVPQALVEADPSGFAAAPVGSGPLMIDEVADDVLRLVPAGGVDAYLEGVELHRFADVAAAYAAFERELVDWSLVPAERAAEAAERHGDDGYRPYQAVLFYGIDVDAQYLADARFREAIVRAVNAGRVSELAYEGTLLHLTGPVPAGVPGHQPDACKERCGHHQARARQLVAAAFPDGAPVVEIAFDEGGRQDAVAAALQDMLQAVDIPVRLRPMPFEEYKTFVASGQQQVFRLGWTGSYPSPDAYLVPLFRTGSPDNVTSLSKPEADQRLALARTSDDPDERRELYRQAERQVMAELPIIPIGQFQILSVARPEVRGLVMAIDGTFDPTAVWLAGDR